MAGLLATTFLSTTAWAQQAPVEDNGDIVVTAQKREESLQDVPLSIVALTSEKLDDLQVQDFDDFARYLPSLSYQTAGPGFSNVYFRGVANGENANHSGQLPSVGTYLDEAPVTTIQGALDVHIYDMARIEALSGPQGTLYGASSQAGTVRLITNKPDTSGFYGGANAEVNTVAHGGQGFVGEGFLNIPITDRVGFRIVGWYDRDAGYIDNIRGTRVFPTLAPDSDGDGNLDDIPGTNTVTNTALVKEDYNEVETYGGRAALSIDLDDSWTVLGQIMGQKQHVDGSFAEEIGAGRLNTIQYDPESSDDSWYQAALTITGKIGSFDLTYAGAYMERKTLAYGDYSDYAFYYDALFGYGAYYVDNAGNPLSDQRTIATDRYTKQSHELRLNWESGPARFVGGVFYQRQTHNIDQNYIIDGLADAFSFPHIGKPDTIWFTKQIRTDRDYAAFGELTVDITPKLSATLGARLFKYDNSLVGFFGYSAGFSSGSASEAACFAPAIVPGSPCTNLNKRTTDTDFIHKINLSYKIDEDKLIYATMSRGFRPGGINRRGNLPNFDADFIDNYEIGWKTSFADGRVRFNGAAYLLNWTNTQFSFLGQNGLTVIQNAGNARVKGIEAELTVVPTRGFTISASGAYTDARLSADYCTFPNIDFNCALPGPDNDGDGFGDANSVQATKGTRLPVTPEFKGNIQARYEFPVGDARAHVQGTMVYQSAVMFDLRSAARALFGEQKGYATADFAAGINFDAFSVELYARNAFDELGGVYRRAQCSVYVCGGTQYNYPIQPRTIGLRLGTKF